MGSRYADHLAQLEVQCYALRDSATEEQPLVTAAEPIVAAPPAIVARAGTLEVPLMDWATLRATVAGCTRCGLEKTRTQTVFGVGDPNADWLVIGEAPGADEDAQGEPFVGRAGQLLNSMLKAIGLERSQIYIANILKCRPPGNRDPKPEEAAHCRPYLERQIELIAPRIILVVGRIAAQTLLQTDTPIGRMRGRLYSFGPRATPVVVTYHPAYLLRSPGEKRKAWSDLLFAQDVLARGHG